MMRARRFLSIGLPSCMAGVLGAIGWHLGEGKSGAPPAPAEPSSLELQAQGAQLLAGIPLHFVENRGQWEGPVRFVTRGSAGMTGFAPGAILLKQEGEDGEGKAQGAVVKLAFQGARSECELQGEEAIPTRYHFLRGQDPAGWRRDVPAYASLRYAGLYEGVDLKVYGQGKTLEYDAILAPGADLAQVEICCQGVEEMRLTEDGTLILLTPLGEIRQRPPRTFQVSRTGEKELLECRYRLIGGDAFGFEVEGRNGSLALLIDPVLEWCTYLGGKKEDRILGLDMDANGVVTVTGDTKSDANFPTTPKGCLPFYNGGFRDAFVARLDPNLNGAAQLVWCTFLGGSREEWGSAVKLGAGGEVNVVGGTDSTDFPLKNPYQATFQGGQQVWDAFVARLDGQGANLLYSTYLGGSGIDYARSLDVAAMGEVLLTGQTSSSGFPATAGAFQTSYQGGPYDAFVSILDPKQSGPAQLTFSTFFGGTGESHGYDGEWIPGGVGEFIVVMNNNGNGVPATRTSGPLGGWDCQIARMNPSLSGSSQLVFLHAFGGTEEDILNDFDFGPGGTLVAVGDSWGRWAGGNWYNAFPTTTGTYQVGHGNNTSSRRSGNDVFVVRFDLNGTMLQSTLLGRDYNDFGRNVAVDNGGLITIAGITEGNFKITCGAWDTTFNGGLDMFIARLSPYLDYLIYSTYLGGRGNEDMWRGSLALDASFQKAVVAGWTLSPNLPTVGNPFQGVPQAAPNASDGFLARLDFLPTGVNRFGMSTPSCHGPISINVTDKPYTNNLNFKLISSGGPGSAYGIFIFGTGGLPTPLTLFGVGFYINFTSSFLTVPLRSDVNGFNEQPFQGPLLPIGTSIGFNYFFQYIWVNTLGCGGANTYSSTDALKVVFQPGC